MTQISELNNEFETALAKIQDRLENPKASTAETELSNELEESNAKMAHLETSLANQQENYLSLSEEYGALELSMDKLKADDSIERENKDLSERLSTLKDESERKIAELGEQNAFLKSETAELKARNADLENSSSPVQTGASNFDELKEQHAQDIENVENILKQLKPLVEG